MSTVRMFLEEAMVLGTGCDYEAGPLDDVWKKLCFLFSEQTCALTSKVRSLRTRDAFETVDIETESAKLITAASELARELVIQHAIDQDTMDDLLFLYAFSARAMIAGVLASVHQDLNRCKRSASSGSKPDQLVSPRKRQRTEARVVVADPKTGHLKITLTSRKQ